MHTYEMEKRIITLTLPEYHKLLWLLKKRSKRRSKGEARIMAQLIMDKAVLEYGSRKPLDPQPESAPPIYPEDPYRAETRRIEKRS